MQGMGLACSHRYLCSSGSGRVFSARGRLGTATHYSPCGFPQVAARTLLKIDLFPGLIAASVWAGQPLDPGRPSLSGCGAVIASPRPDTVVVVLMSCTDPAQSFSP